MSMFPMSLSMPRAIVAAHRAIDALARACAVAAAAMLLLPSPALAAAPSAVQSAPPLVSPGEPKAAAAASLLLPRDAPARRVDLGMPTAAEEAVLARRPQAGMTQKRLAIGFGRAVPQDERSIRLDSLDWQVMPDGTRVAHIQVASTGARSLRIALAGPQADPDIVLRLQGSDAAAEVMGPYVLNEIAQASTGDGQWWSPVLEGSTATIEIAVGAGASVGATALILTRVSHMVANGSTLANGLPALATGPGTSQSCEHDWKCVPPTGALTNAAKAQALITFQEADGSGYLCSATLVADTTATYTPYVFTANHCMDTPDVAATVNLYWFFDSIGCSSAEDGNASKKPGAYSLQKGGATLLATSIADDWSLIRLKTAPPAGTVFSAWNSVAVATGEALDLHHPNGDLTKYSIGDLQGYGYFQVIDDDGDYGGNGLFTIMRWDITRGGIAEGGSSGSGLLTYNAGKGWYELRGALSGASTTCADPTAPSVFARLDYAIPKVRDYLAPGTAASNLGVVVEYYHAGLDHYFMTMDAGEVASLDSGAFAGWQRTGLRFLAYKTPVAGSSPVCRAYLEANGSSTHFYSAVAAECDLLGKAPAFKDWVVETRSAFYVKTPDASGNCALGTHPIWRFFHAAVTNHRFTDDLTVHDRLGGDAAWAAEGYGPDAVIMCSPDGA